MRNEDEEEDIELMKKALETAISMPLLLCCYSFSVLILFLFLFLVMQKTLTN